MADPIRLPFMKDTLGAPEGQQEEVGVLPCHRSTNAVLSAWRLSPEELAHVQKTGVVLVHIMGSTHAPLAVGVMAPEEKRATALDAPAPSGTGGVSQL